MGGLTGPIEPSPVACCCLAIEEFSSGACLLSLGQATLTEKSAAAVTWACPPGRDAARSAPASSCQAPRTGIEPAEVGQGPLDPTLALPPTHDLAL